MSDETTSARPTPTGIVEHWCEHPGCKEWGGWGYENRRTKITAWFCYPHRDRDYLKGYPGYRPETD